MRSEVGLESAKTSQAGLVPGFDAWTAMRPMKPSGPGAVSIWSLSPLPS